MPVAPLELQRVLADQFDPPEFEVVRDVDGKNNSNSGHLVFTGGAGTHSAKHWSQMMSLVAVGPLDHQLAGINLLDLRGVCGLYVCPARHHSTSLECAHYIRALT